MRGRVVLIANTFRLEMQGQFMICTVEVQDAVDIELAIDTIGLEGGLGIALTLENLLVHAAVASATSTFATGNVDDDFAGRFTGIRVVMDRASLQFERSMHGMQNVVQRELNVGFCGIEIQRRATRNGQPKQKEREESRSRHAPPTSARRSRASPQRFGARPAAPAESDRASASTGP